ncbi:MAG: shikimate kinase [Firmicutes bacterium]|nr:shikimate kinase [Bacillota bacterium]
MQTERKTEKLNTGIPELPSEEINLVLIGMPGCGKTTLGKLAAEELGRPFLSLDSAVAERFGPIEEIITGEGEERFRDLESSAILENAHLRGHVIATGGGAVLRPENMEALRESSLFIWIKRPLSLLETEGRPLSKGPKALEKLLEKRLPLYGFWADASIVNEGDPKEAAEALVSAFKELTKPSPVPRSH